MAVADWLSQAKQRDAGRDTIPPAIFKINLWLASISLEYIHKLIELIKY